MLATEVKPGVSTLYLDKLAEEFIRSEGAIPGFLGLYDFPNTLCMSPNSQVVHGIPNKKPLIEGDIKNVNDCVIYGDGSKRRDFTQVDDIVDGLIKINECNEWGRTFEFGRGKNYSVNEVADMFGIKPIYERDKPGEAQNTLNIDLTASVVLGWKPQINLVDYIKNTEWKKYL